MIPARMQDPVPDSGKSGFSFEVQDILIQGMSGFRLRACFKNSCNCHASSLNNVPLIKILYI
jgi:hypothetical protein